MQFNTEWTQIWPHWMTHNSHLIMLFIVPCAIFIHYLFCYCILTEISECVFNFAQVSWKREEKADNLNKLPSKKYLESRGVRWRSIQETERSWPFPCTQAPSSSNAETVPQLLPHLRILTIFTSWTTKSHPHAVQNETHRAKHIAAGPAL